MILLDDLWEKSHHPDLFETETFKACMRSWNETRLSESRIKQTSTGVLEPDSIDAHFDTYHKIWTYPPSVDRVLLYDRFASVWPPLPSPSKRDKPQSNQVSVPSQILDNIATNVIQNRRYLFRGPVSGLRTSYHRHHWYCRLIFIMQEDLEGWQTLSVTQRVTHQAKQFEQFALWFTEFRLKFSVNIVCLKPRNLQTFGWNRGSCSTQNMQRPVKASSEGDFSIMKLIRADALYSRLNEAWAVRTEVALAPILS